MSKIRTRPTRDDTCEKLFEAAARVFEEQGIGGASIEAIAAAAGFTRGAFYSNFNSKDELIIAMLEDHVEQSIRRNLDLLAKHKNIADFIDALQHGPQPAGSARSFFPAAHGDDPVRGARREAPARACQAAAGAEKTDHGYRRNHVEERAAGADRVNPTWTGAVLLALEDGFRLHRLIDPETTPADSFLRAIGDLQRVVGISSEISSA